jgi:predicted transcriptional regulator
MKAEDFYDKKDVNGLPMSFNEKMIEFAKYHVEQALKAASEEFNSKTYSQFIVEAYSLDLIK